MFEQEQVTYVAGEWNTFNGAIEIIESFYGTPVSITPSHLLPRLTRFLVLPRRTPHATHV